MLDAVFVESDKLDLSLNNNRKTEVMVAQRKVSRVNV